MFVKELNCLYIDLDYYKTGKVRSQILMDLEKNYFNKKIKYINILIN